MKIGPETSDQITVYAWVKRFTDLPFIHVPNENKRSYFNGSILNRMGVRPGVSDIFIPRANATYHGLFIELKAGKNKPTLDQRIFIKEMNAEKYFATWCTGADAAIKVIQDFYML